MIENIWSGKNKLYLLLLPFSWLYGLIVLIRCWLYKISIFQSWKAPVPVIVVGNLTVGGNGKTPVVIYLVEQLKQRGYRVGVVSRGYGGKSQHYPLVLDEHTSPLLAGDEPVLIYQRTHVPVAVAPKRAEAVQALLAAHPLDIIVTDDGLQHYALQRDIEIVVMDGQRGFGNGWWLPAGPMRERIGRLTTVDLTIVNGQLATEKLLHNSVIMQLVPTQAVNVLTGDKCDVHQLAHIQAMAGIGYPPRFFTMLKDMNIHLEETYAFADHQSYQLEQLRLLASPEQTLLMTEKDAIKCYQFAQSNWWYIPIDAILPESTMNILCNKIKGL